MPGTEDGFKGGEGRREGRMGGKGGGGGRRGGGGRTDRHEERSTLAELGRLVGSGPGGRLVQDVALAVQDEHVGRDHALLLDSGGRHHDPVLGDLMRQS